MTIAELVALARTEIVDALLVPPVEADLNVNKVAEAVIAIFGSLPDWPCGWTRPSIDTTGRVQFADGEITMDPDEAVAIGLAIFESGRGRP